MWGDNAREVFTGVRGELSVVLSIGTVFSEAMLVDIRLELGVAEGAEKDGGTLNGEDCFGGWSWWWQRLLVVVGVAALVMVSSTAVSAITGKLSLGCVSWEAHRTLENI